MKKVSHKKQLSLLASEKKSVFRFPKIFHSTPGKRKMILREREKKGDERVICRTIFNVSVLE